jgi:HlyD family secretion protein
MSNQQNYEAVKQPLSEAVKGKNKMLITTLMVVVVVVALLAIVGFMFMKPEPDVIQGQGDATEIRISGKLPGRVAEIYVEEGTHVKAGDTLVRIHSSVVEAKLAQAEAMEGVAKATNRKVDAGTRPQIISAAHDVWQQAIAAAEITRKTYERMENLFAKGVISEQKRDEAKAAYEAAKSGQEAAKSQYELALAGAQSEDKDAAKAMVNAAKGSINEVDAVLEDQYLVAPCDGVITVIYPNVSELVSTGAPIMTLQKDDCWAVFNVRETYLKNIRNGSEIKVRIPALELDTVMKVFYIRDLGTYANWQATKAKGDYDARTFQVKARPEKNIDGFLPGMSVILVQE